MSGRNSVDIIASSELPDHEAVRLLQMATDCPRSSLLLGLEVDPSDESTFRDLERRRSGGEPLQYIEGTAAFGFLELAVDERVLVPRPETEEILELVPSLVEAPNVIVDLCTGSGNLAIALGSMYPSAEVHATDLSADALAVAVSNAEAHGVAISFAHGDVFEPLPMSLAGTVDLLVANPPYLAESEYADLPDDVKREPMSALVAGPKGDEVLARIAEGAPRWLAPGGVVLCEISEFHGPRIVELFASVDARLVQDLSGKDRFVLGRRRVD